MSKNKSYNVQDDTRTLNKIYGVLNIPENQ